jgi:hypothetical protein
VPFFFSDEGEALGLAFGVSPGVGDGVSLGVGEGVSAGEGEGDFLRFFDFGEVDGSGVSVALGLGEADGEGWRFFDFGVAEGSGVSSVFGFGDREGVGETGASSFSFFFVEAVCRFFRGDGVGVGASIFLILLPNDSAVRPRSATPKSSAMKRTELAILLIRRISTRNVKIR